MKLICAGSESRKGLRISQATDSVKTHHTTETHVPGKPGTPRFPKIPGAPGDPGGPTGPDRPGAPCEPTTPAKPCGPGFPNGPVAPGKPVAPNPPVNVRIRMTHNMSRHDKCKVRSCHKVRKIWQTFSQTNLSKVHRWFFRAKVINSYCYS